MKITFIVGSFEPGKDGVGDYSRKLGNTLNQSGHHVTYIAWNDLYVNECDETDQWLRFGTSTKESQKIERIRAFLKKQKTDCISLQYVAYAYDGNGITTRLRKVLMALNTEAIFRHIMIHEIWIGAEKDSPLKHKLLGQLQKRSFKKLLKTWAPQCIHTQAPFYQTQLRKIGVNAELLPLFSNIDIHQAAENIASDEGKMTGIVFGSIPDGWDIPRFAEKLTKLSQIEGKLIHLRCIGRNGAHYETFEQAILKEQPALSIENVGELPESEISQTIQRGNFGVGLARPHLLCKSGTAAAFDEHGLPILCARAGKIPTELRERRYFQVPLVNLEEIGRSPIPGKIEKRNKVAEVSKQMMADLDAL